MTPKRVLCMLHLLKKLFGRWWRDSLPHWSNISGQGLNLESRWISDVATWEVWAWFFLRLPPKALPGSTRGGGGGGWGRGGWGGEGEGGGGEGGWRQQRLHPSPRPPSPWRGESHARAQILKNPRNPQKIPAHLLLLTSLTPLLLNIHSICFPIRTITSNHIKP